MAQRVNDLCSDFSYYISKFDTSNPFTGRTLYSHFRTLKRLRECGALAIAFQDNLFFEYLYDTLIAWGLNKRGSKLVDFETFRSSLRNHESELENLEDCRLTTLPEGDIDVVVDSLWQILATLRVSQAETKLVANSKALHHLLPQLMPPIDRRYTLKFFYRTPSGGDEQIFREIYRQFHRIGSRSEVAINKHLGHGFHTSETKVIDNAIVGYVLARL